MGPTPVWDALPTAKSTTWIWYATTVVDATSPPNREEHALVSGGLGGGGDGGGDGGGGGLGGGGDGGGGLGGEGRGGEGLGGEGLGGGVLGGEGFGGGGLGGDGLGGKGLGGGGLGGGALEGGCGGGGGGGLSTGTTAGGGGGHPLKYTSHPCSLARDVKVTTALVSVNVPPVKYTAPPFCGSVHMVRHGDTTGAERFAQRRGRVATGGAGSTRRWRTTVALLAVKQAFEAVTSPLVPKIAPPSWRLRQKKSGAGFSFRTLPAEFCPNDAPATPRTALESRIAPPFLCRFELDAKTHVTHAGCSAV